MNVFFLGSYEMNRSAAQTNLVYREAFSYYLFVSPSDSFPQKGAQSRCRSYHNHTQRYGNSFRIFWKFTLHNDKTNHPRFEHHDTFDLNPLHLH